MSGAGLRLVVVGTMALVVAAAVLLLPSPDASLSGPRDAGTLRVGYAVEAPYAFVGADGQVQGEAPAVAKHVVRALGIDHIEWVQTSFAALLPDLMEGRFQVVAAGLFITAERQRLVAFSQPTFRVGAGLLHLFGTSLGPCTCQRLAAAPDQRFAVVDGAVEGPRLRACGLAAIQIVPVPDVATGKAAVVTGLVTGLVLSEPAVRWMALHEPTAALATSPLALDPLAPDARAEGAFAFRQQDRALREAWDRVLSGWIGSPEHLAAVQDFGFRAEDLPQRPPRSVEAAP